MSKVGTQFRFKRRFETAVGCRFRKDTVFTLYSHDLDYLFETEHPGTYLNTGESLPFDDNCQHPEVYFYTKGLSDLEDLGGCLVIAETGEIVTAACELQK